MINIITYSQQKILGKEQLNPSQFSLAVMKGAYKQENRGLPHGTYHPQPQVSR